MGYEERKYKDNLNIEVERERERKIVTKGAQERAASLIVPPKCANDNL